jgi:hypothetical protein
MRLTMSKKFIDQKGLVSSLEIGGTYSRVFFVVLVPNDQERVDFSFMDFFLVLWVFSVGGNSLDCVLTLDPFFFGLGD